MHQIKRIFLGLLGLLTVLSLIFVTIKCTEGGAPEEFCLPGYALYPLDRGYGPGSIVSVTSAGLMGNRQTVKDLQISREKMMKEILLPSCLALTGKKEISSCTFDRTRDFESLINSKVEENRLVGKDGFSARQTMRGIKYATFSVSEVYPIS
ncbi:MAG: hypothetical protein AAFN92_04125 [Bacteroidota bacterium]